MRRLKIQIPLMVLALLGMNNLRAEDKKPEISKGETEIIEYSARLRTLHYEKTQKELAHFVGNAGGYVVTLNRYSMVAYLPAGMEIRKFTTVMEKNGYVISSSVNKENPQERVKDLELLLDVKLKHRKAVMALLKGADTSSTLDIEVELGDILQQIEDITGELKYLQERQKMSKVNIGFDIIHNPTVNDYKDFSWLEKMNIPAFIQRFDQ